MNRASVTARSAASSALRSSREALPAEQDIRVGRTFGEDEHRAKFPFRSGRASGPEEELRAAFNPAMDGISPP